MPEVVGATTVGERIKEKRRELAKRLGRKVTQDDLAERAKVAVSTVRKWETDVQQPEGQNLVGLAAALETTPEYLLGATPNGRAVREPPPHTYAEPGPFTGELAQLNAEGLTGLQRTIRLETIVAGIRAEAQRREGIAAEHRAAALRAEAESAVGRARTAERYEGGIDARRRGRPIRTGTTPRPLRDGEERAEETDRPGA